MRIRPSLRSLSLAVSLAVTASFSFAGEILVEAESFAEKGGWSTDAQFIDAMGSPYLLAHGLGKPVADASTEVLVPQRGRYHVYVRTYNWTSPWHKGDGPGGLQVCINGAVLPGVVGSHGHRWEWQYAGAAEVETGSAILALHDLKGFDGRCDAVFLTTDSAHVPPAAGELLKDFRKSFRGRHEVAEAGIYDLVVVGGGVAGMSAAASAARLGCRVALVQNRPVLGGNNSSEVRVHMGGCIDIGKYPALGGLQKEFSPLEEGNARPARFYEDDKKLQWIGSHENIDLFLDVHVNEVEMTRDSSAILSVTGIHVPTGQRIRFTAPLFSDCTGDGTVGFLAGADFLTGREGRDEYGEPSAPETADFMTMGASVQWRTRSVAPASGIADTIHNSKDAFGKYASFPVFDYGVAFDDRTCRRTDVGEWTWETGMYADQINDFERVRDYGMLVAYSNWSYLKNNLGLYPDRVLDWVAYVGGKRETRRLLGDYILKEDDLVKRVAHEDASFTASWSIDLHFPDRANSADFPPPGNDVRTPGGSFLASNRHVFIHPYAVPYRCLYSRNVDNLFMAGRNISCTHVALGTVRVMRTTGQMGEVVGMAAYLCRKFGVHPRDIYRRHLPALRSLMSQGVADPLLPNNQTYNEGHHLSDGF